MMQKWKLSVLTAGAAAVLSWLQFGPSFAKRTPRIAMPEIVFVAPKALQSDVCPSDADCLSAKALYVPAERRIYLRNDWSAERFDDLSVLLHEFVHHLQTIGKIEYGCDPEIELPAYQIQEAFYAAHHRKPDGHIPSNFTRFSRYSCVANE